MHACWIFLCMSLNLVSYAFLLIKEGIGKSTKSNDGIEGSIPRPIDGWGCYTDTSKEIKARMEKNEQHKLVQGGYGKLKA
jgi:hypothetical protein